MSDIKTQYIEMDRGFFLCLKKEEKNTSGVSLALDARRMAPCGMSSSLPLPEGFLLFVVR